MKSGNLTLREARAADLVLQGLKNKEIAPEIGCSVGNTNLILRRVYRKKGVRSRAELIIKYAHLVLEGKQG